MLAPREYTPAEAAALEEGARALGLAFGDLLLEPQLDGSYRAAKGDGYPWRR